MFKYLFLTASALALLSSALRAEERVEELVVRDRKPIIPQNIPATVEGIDAEEIGQTINVITTQEVLKYLPSIEVRERFIGDRNSIVSTRTTGTLSSAQSIVYGDELLLSNFLGNSFGYPPRWGMVSPAEIERLDVIYGPFSALYPGNSMGGVVVMQTKMPDKFEAHATFQTFMENFDLYGTQEHYQGFHANVSVGNKITDRLSFWLSADRLDNKSHPMSFATATQSSTAAGAETVVTGYHIDKSEKNLTRYIFGGYGIDQSSQENAKLKLAYDITPTTKATYQLGVWQVDSDSSVQTYLKTSTGEDFYNGSVNIGGNKYTVSGLNPSHSNSLHLMNGLALKTDSKGIFDWELSSSLYTYMEDNSRSASSFPNPAGTIQTQDGTGWGTADARGVWRPVKGVHEVSFGYHFDRYHLNSGTFDTTNWDSGPETTFNSSSEGKTQTEAVYLQEAWQFHPDWKLTLGGRGEYWKAFEGYNQNTLGRVSYLERDSQKFSPKASLAYQMTPELSHRVSAGKAYRFPTVNELFQRITSSSRIVENNPNLRPEHLWSYDWTSEYNTGKNSYRLSFFLENRTDALVSQTDTVLNRTQIDNVDSVRINGIEAAFQTRDILIKGLDFKGSLTWADSVVLRNQQNSNMIGKGFQRIPEWRAKGVLSYRQSDDLSYSAGVRYSSGGFGQLDNSDVNHSVYSGISPYIVTDFRVNYKLVDGVTLAAGLDNAFGEKYYVAHPYPQNSFLLELKYDY